MGRRACRFDWRGRGLGKLLVGSAVDRGLKTREQGAAYPLNVDAKDEAAMRFCERFASGGRPTGTWRFTCRSVGDPPLFRDE